MNELGAEGTRYAYENVMPGLLDYFPNPGHSREEEDLAIVIDTDEFTSLCPKTGQPDWARIVVRYVPNERCVESKSWKLYLGSYRNHGEFHEACVMRMLRDLVELLDPVWIRVEGRFTPRGGISFWPVAEWQHPEFGQPAGVTGPALLNFDRTGRTL